MVKKNLSSGKKKEGRLLENGSNLLKELMLIVKVKPFLYETFLLLRSLKLPRTSIVVVMYCNKDSTYGTKVLSKTDLKRSYLRDPFFFTYFILIPPSSFNVREKIAEVGGEVSRMRRNSYMIQSKGYTSELEELDSR
ncbi:hypothetical protein F2Q69_00061539 [Brassica cretica]|uniref:Uncharacterized protein n=1 Tax=Brassica cretica TaxID=69181 RepID=A0A8S9RBY3_BRACR|nr:hypothetical protein F2Q69_00061539 [Brassica cretica]